MLYMSLIRNYIFRLHNQLIKWHKELVVQICPAIKIDYSGDFLDMELLKDESKSLISTN